MLKRNFLSVFILLFAFLGAINYSVAQDASGAVMPLEFENTEHQQRYQHFSKILRCPMCQNQNLSGSDAGIAADLRKTLYRLIGEDKTDQEIIDFMQARYGNFILYDPPMNRATFLLWFGPAVLLLAGVYIARKITQRPVVANAGSVALSEAEKHRARQLLTSVDQQNNANIRGDGESTS